MSTATNTAAARIRSVAVLAVAVAALAGCSTADGETEPAAEQAASLNIVDPWVKAAESGMSAAFGTLENDGDAEITVVSAASGSSPMIELHETVADAAGQMVMQEKDGGFVVPAGGAYELTPGGNHLMLMGLEEAVVAGDEVSFVLELADGSTFEFTAAARDYAGANESYESGESMEMEE